jgi:hypothetical protein
LEHAATHCNTLQHTATHCNTLQHSRSEPTTNFTAIQLLSHCIHCNSNTLQHTATHCISLQHLQHTAIHCDTLQQRRGSRQHIAPQRSHCNTLQHNRWERTTNSTAPTLRRGPRGVLWTGALWLHSFAEHCRMVQDHPLICVTDESRHTDESSILHVQSDPSRHAIIFSLHV